MSNTKYNIKTLKDNNYFDSTIELVDNGKDVRLLYVCNETKVDIDDRYPFFALVKLRLQLESSNTMLLCNGARRDVYPSGMSAVGIMAYQLDLGKQATKLVNIFESTGSDKLATVSEQKNYREEWLKSLGI